MLNLQCFNSARGGVEMSTHNLVKTKSHLKKLSIQCVFSFFFKKKDFQLAFYQIHSNLISAVLQSSVEQAGKH